MNKLFILMVFLFYSCIITPKYHFFTLKNLTDFSVKTTDKFILLKNNLPPGFQEFSRKIDTDFSKMITTISIDPYLNDYDNTKYISQLNEDLLDRIKDDTESNYLLLIQTILKPAPASLKNFSSVTTYEQNKTREYHVILRLIDLEDKKVLYVKESISRIKIPYDYSTISPDEESQLIKTYDILFKDFEKSYREKTN